MSFSLAPPAQNALEQIPVLLSEQQVVFFKFYFNQAVRTGMSHRNELYQLIQIFDAQARLEAYRFGCDLIVQGVPVVISRSKDQYLVWSSLRHPSTAIR